MPDRDSVVRSAHRETVAVVVGRNVHNDACEAHACVTALCEPPELHLHAPGVHSFKKKTTLPFSFLLFWLGLFDSLQQCPTKE